MRAVGSVLLFVMALKHPAQILVYSEPKVSVVWVLFRLDSWGIRKCLQLSDVSNGNKWA